jgi:hypothetical protein
MSEVAAMLGDIAQSREEAVGQGHRSCADAHFIAALAHGYLGRQQAALGHLELARSLYGGLGDSSNAELLQLARDKLEAMVGA